MEIINESDEMRASDRLVDRIRLHQQQKIYVYETFVLILLISVFCNIIADSIMSLLIGVSQESLRSTVFWILSVSLFSTIVLVLLLYSYTKRYYEGSLETYIPFGFEVIIRTHKNTVSLANEIWERINPLSQWMLVKASQISPTIQGPRLIYFSKNYTEEKDWDTMDKEKYDIILTGDWISVNIVSSYKSLSKRAFSFLIQKVSPPKKIEIPNLGSLSVQDYTSCRVTIGLSTKKKENYKYLIGFWIFMRLIGPIRPESDELIQDISIYLRSLRKNLYSTLENLSK